MKYFCLVFSGFLFGCGKSEPVSDEVNLPQSSKKETSVHVRKKDPEKIQLVMKTLEVSGQVNTIRGWVEAGAEQVNAEDREHFIKQADANELIKRIAEKFAGQFSKDEWEEILAWEKTEERRIFREKGAELKDKAQKIGTNYTLSIVLEKEYEVPILGDDPNDPIRVALKLVESLGIGKKGKEAWSQTMLKFGHGDSDEYKKWYAAIKVEELNLLLAKEVVSIYDTNVIKKAVAFHISPIGKKYTPMKSKMGQESQVIAANYFREIVRSN